MNPLYNTLGGNQLQALMTQLRSNPIQFLMQRSINVPLNLSNNPQAIIQHLLNTGQMSQDIYNRINQFVNR